MKNIIIIIIIIFSYQSLFPQGNKILLSGIIQNSNGVQLPYATVRIKNSPIGTVCDKTGKFEIPLSRGYYDIIISYIGFQSHRVSLDLEHDTTIVAILSPSEIQLSEVIIDGEDPAYTIIRKAISRKKKWKEQIGSFKARTYTKDTFGNDTLLGLISEAYSDLYWVKGNPLKEIVLYRRQSSNLPKEFQYALVRDFINFNNDSIHQWGYTFITPLADSAFQYYDYKLIKTFSNDTHTYYDIEVIPLSQIKPLFAGRIIITDSIYALQRVILHPNNIFKIPFLDIVNFEFTQQFSLYDTQYWFPLEYHISAQVRIRYMLIKFPMLFDYSKAVICYEYFPNTSINDSIQEKSSLTLLPSAKEYDTTQWKNVKVFPLTKLENDSYQIIDKKVKENPFFFSSFSLLQNSESILNSIDIHYNRVEGLFLGGKLPVDLTSNVQLSASLGYGISDDKIKSNLQIEYRFTPVEISTGFEVYNKLSVFPINLPFKPFLNSITTFLNGQDYYNYFSQKGGKFFISFKKYPWCLMVFSLIDEYQSTEQKNADFAIRWIGKNGHMNSNESINDGKLRAMRFELSNRSEDKLSFFEEPQNLWNLVIENSSRKYESAFDYLSAYSNVFLRFLTMDNSRLFNPYLGISASIGYSHGIPPIQRIFSFETPLSSIAFQNSFRTVSALEFTGDNFYACSVEHNFRNIPFVLIGLPSINVDLIVRAAAGEMWSNSTLLSTVSHSTIKMYKEYTIGFGRIGDFFRLDFSYSDYQPKRYSATLSGGL